MIGISVMRDEADRVVRLSASGHARYAPRGSDIVCSAVSALMQTAILGTSDRGASTSVGPGGRAKIRFASAPDPEVAFLLDTIVRGLEEIRQQYPECLLIVFRRARRRCS